MMKKRVISVITAIFLMITVFCVPSFAAEQYRPLSNTYTWSEWSTSIPPTGAEYETKTQYSYRDKSFVSNGYYNYTGYTRSASTLVSTTYGEWYRAPLNESDTQGTTYRTIVKNQTANAYFSYAGVCDCKTWFWKTQTGSHKNGTCKTKNVLKVYSAKRLPNTGYKYDGECYEVPAKIGTNNPGKFGTIYLVLLNDKRIGTFTSNASITCLWQGGGDDTRKMYRTVTNKYQYTHWKWGGWSAYSDSYVSSTANREVQTRTVYRYKANGQVIGGASEFNKVYGDSPFNLGASANTGLSYSSSNTDIATVSSTGTVTIKNTGTVTITIKAAASTLYNAATKYVTINIEKASPVLTYEGETEINKTYGAKTFLIEASSKNGVQYSSNNTNVLTVSDTGVVTLKSAGTAVITIMTPASNTYNVETKSITVKVAKASQKIKCKVKNNINKKVGSQAFNLGATAKTKLTYTTSNKRVATVSSDGWVTIKNPGTATITIKTTSSDKYFVESKKIKVTVTKRVQQIKCNANSIENKYYGAKAFNLGAKAKGKCTYFTSNKKIATVNAKGLVTLKNPGTVTITIKAAATGKYKPAIKKIKINVALKAPTLTAEAIGQDKVSLTVGNSTGATGYEIYVKEPGKSKYDLQSKIVKSGSAYKLYSKSSNGWTYIKKLSNRTVRNANLKKGKLYEYKVKAYKNVNNKKNYSKFSVIQSVIVE